MVVRRIKDYRKLGYKFPGSYKILKGGPSFSFVKETQVSFPRDVDIFSQNKLILYKRIYRHDQSLLTIEKRYLIIPTNFIYHLISNFHFTNKIIPIPIYSSQYCTLLLFHLLLTNNRNTISTIQRS